MTNWILSILALLFLNTHTLHLFQTVIYNEEKYLTQVQNIHDKFKQDLINIKNKLDQFKKQLAATQGNDRQRIKVLKNGLTIQRGQLIDLENYLKLPYGLKACKCKGFTDDLKSILSSDLQTTSFSIQKLKDDLIQWPNCRLANQLKSQVSRQQQYLSSIKEIANSDCHRPPKSFLPDQPTGLINLNESNYISNLQHSKWIFGSIAPSDYKYQMFSLSTKSNLTKCSDDTPFTKDGKTCISCPDNNPIWSVGDSICTTCGVGEHYNVFGHNCSTGNSVVQQQQAKVKGINYYGEQKSMLTSGFNRNRHGTNYINTPPDIDPDLKTCSLNQPFFNGKGCISCQSPKIFNFGTMTCQECPSGTTYNIKHKLCSSQYFEKHVTNLNAKNIIVGINKSLLSYQQQQQAKLSKNPELTQCPQTSPYFDGQSCIQCTVTKPYFNLYSQQCENCDIGFSYFQTLNNCTINIYLTNSNAKRLIQSNNATVSSIYQQANFLKKNNPYNRLELCSLEKPFSKNFVCINCTQQTPLFNLQTQQCTNCLDQTFYDEETKRCVGNFLTNPDSPNLYYQGVSRQQYSQQYQSLKNRFSNIQDCPEYAPYFDGTRCVSCAQSTPLFSIRTKMCGQCPVGKIFSVQNGNCIDQL